jgi:hypothetical protein
MTIFATKTMNQWCIFLTLILGTIPLFSSCGKLARSASSEVAIHLALPEGENPELFWYGVQTKVLRVEKDGKEPMELPWQ